VAVLGLDASPHRTERLRDPLHRPGRERLVSDELEAPLLAGEDAREEPHERAGVPAVQRPARLLEAAKPDALHAHELTCDLDPRPECPHGRRRRERVLGGPEAVDLALAVGDRSEQERAVGDGLVARNGDVTADRRRRLDLHQSSKAGETITE
jgi:hypothetical protein